MNECANHSAFSLEDFFLAPDAGRVSRFLCKETSSDDYAREETNTALIVWRRFPACWNTMEAGDSNTSSVTSTPPASSGMRFDDGFTDLSLHVVISGQTVHELHVGIAGSFHEFLVDLIWKKRSDTFVPNFFGLAHRDPNICMDEINAFDRGFGSSVIVILAPEALANSRHISMSS